MKVGDMVYARAGTRHPNSRYGGWGLIIKLSRIANPSRQRVMVFWSKTKRIQRHDKIELRVVT